MYKVNAVVGLQQSKRRIEPPQDIHGVEKFTNGKQPRKDTLLPAQLQKLGKREGVKGTRYPFVAEKRERNPPILKVIPLILSN